MVLEALLGRRSELLARRYAGFKQDYIASDRFTYSQAITTVLWILSAITHNLFDPILLPYVPGWVEKYFLQIGFSVLALATLLVIGPGYHYWKEKPFRFQIDWYPLSHQLRVHKEKWRDNLGLERDDKMYLVTATKLLENMDGYELELECSDPSSIEFSVWRVNGDQDPSADRTKIECSNVQHEEFINLFTLEKTGELGGGVDHYVRLLDVTENEPREVFKLDVRE